MIEATEQLSQALAAIAAQLRRVTVQVKDHRHGTGSGVIWNPAGVIITNAHVVQGNSAQVELADGRQTRAAVIARNPQRDLVALQVNLPDLPVAPIGDSDRLQVGELVLAVGNPFGVTGALTSGIIHNLGSPEFSQRSWVQADIRLAPGNSGGPLANARGEVIGINTMIVNDRGFAIPSNGIQQFLQSGNRRPYLGVSVQPVQVLVQRRRAFGLLVTQVEPGTPAASAHLQLGDILLGVQGRFFTRPDHLTWILENSNVGDGLSLDVLRGDRQIVAEIILCSKDSEVQAA